MRRPGWDHLNGVNDRDGTKEHIAGIDVVSCADRHQAIQFAAAHPIARCYAIEVRPFYSE